MKRLLLLLMLTGCMHRPQFYQHCVWAATNEVVSDRFCDHIPINGVMPPLVGSTWHYTTHVYREGVIDTTGTEIPVIGAVRTSEIDDSKYVRAENSRIDLDVMPDLYYPVFLFNGFYRGSDNSHGHGKRNFTVGRDNGNNRARGKRPR